MSEVIDINEILYYTVASSIEDDYCLGATEAQLRHRLNHFQRLALYLDGLDYIINVELEA